MGLAGTPDYAALSYEQRREELERRLAGPPLEIPPAALSFSTRGALDTFRAILDIQRSGGERACRTYIVSMAHSQSDVLSVLFLAREAGLGRESLYKALSPDGNPEFATILKVVRALGLRLHAEAVST